MDLGLKDRTIFVAGASRGIGLGIVEACLAEGAKVAITARGAYRMMAPRGEGSVLMISSIAGLGALGTPLTYGTAKAAMTHLGKELAKITCPSGVRVNTLAPGNIIFPGGTWQERMDGPRAGSWQRWLDREVPMKRYGLPEEIGSVAAFLMSPRASFVHGTVVPVDGGQTR